MDVEVYHFRIRNLYCPWLGFAVSFRHCNHKNDHNENRCWVWSVWTSKTRHLFLAASSLQISEPLITYVSKQKYKTAVIDSLLCVNSMRFYHVCGKIRTDILEVLLGKCQYWWLSKIVSHELPVIIYIAQRHFFNFYSTAAG